MIVFKRSHFAVWLLSVCASLNALPQLREQDLGGDAVFRKAYEEARHSALSGADADVLRLGRLLQANDFLEAAVRCYETIDPNSAVAREANYLMACALEGRGQLDSATRLLEALRAKGTLYGPALLRLARLRESSGDTDGALQLYQEALETEHGGEGALMGLARLAMRANAFEAAIDRLREGVERYPESGDIALLLGNAYQRIGDEGEAGHYLEIGKRRMRHTSANDPWLDSLRRELFGTYRISYVADTLFTALRFEEAQLVLERGVRLYPNSSDLWFGSGKLAFASDRRQEAFSAWEKAVRGEGATAQMFAVLADERMQDGQDSEAAQVLEDARSRGISSARLFKLEAVLLVRSQGNQAAMAVIDEGLRAFPNDQGLARLGGDLARSEESWEQAELFYRMALQRDPSDELLNTRLTESLISQARWEAAFQCLADYASWGGETDRVDRLRAEVWETRGFFLRERGAAGWTDALQSAMRLQAADENRFRSIVSVFLSSEEWSAVLDLSEIAGEPLSESALVQKVAGVASLQLGRLDDGLEYLKSAHDLAEASGDLVEAGKLRRMLVSLSGNEVETDPLPTP